jgi:hypothetical protein
MPPAKSGGFPFCPLPPAHKILWTLAGPRSRLVLYVLYKIGGKVKVTELLVENFKKVRVVEIRPDGRVITLTGRNGQGKTSVLDAMWFGLRGTKALPEKKGTVVRKGSDRAKVRVGTEDFVITRTVGKEGNPPTLVIEMRGDKKREGTPQDFLDHLFGALTFDPQAFAVMDPADQVEELKRAAKVDIDFEEIAAANEVDYNERKGINREVALLEGQRAGLQVLVGLPKEKVNEEAITKQLNEAGEANKRAQETFRAKEQLGAESSRIGAQRVDTEKFISDQHEIVRELEKRLALAKQGIEVAEKEAKKLKQQHTAAELAYRNAPTGDPIDVSALAMELQSAQRTNRAIDTRDQWEKLGQQLDEKRRKADALTRQIEAREEKKRTALSKAKMPIEGLSFDENGVQFNGIQFENMGEGEQLRIAAEIGMAANPKLRILCIRRGEALDDQGLKMLAKLAEERDFQLWITKVDTSGKVGVVLEDGMVVTNNAE